MTPEEYVEGELAELERRYGGRHLSMLYRAIELCAFYERPWPAWACDALLALTPDKYLEYAARACKSAGWTPPQKTALAALSHVMAAHWTGRGRSRHSRPRTREVEHARLYTYWWAVDFLQKQKVSWKNIYRIASVWLYGHEGHWSAIQQGYKRVLRYRRAGDASYRFALEPLNGADCTRLLIKYLSNSPEGRSLRERVMKARSPTRR